MVEVDRGDEQVDPRRRVGADVEPQRRDLVVQRAHDRRALGAGLGRRVARRGRDGVEPHQLLRHVARVRVDQVPPAERVQEQPLAAERLAPLAEQLARAQRREPGERHPRAVGAVEPLQRAPGARPQPVAAAELEHRRELHQPAGVAEVVHAPHPGALARVAEQVRDPLDHARHPVGALVADERLAVLHVVVERPVDVLDPARGERADRQPVVVEVRELVGRERQRVVEQRPREERRGAGHRVRDQQRVHVVVVVRAPRPVRARDQLAVRPDHARVAVDEARVRRARRRGSPACPGASGRPGRRAPRSARRRGRARARARSCGRSRAAEARGRRRSAGRRRPPRGSSRGRLGEEPSSEMTHSQSRWVCARIDSTCARNRSGGGS